MPKPSSTGSWHSTPFGQLCLLTLSASEECLPCHRSQLGRPSQTRRLYLLSSQRHLRLTKRASDGILMGCGQAHLMKVNTDTSLSLRSSPPSLTLLHTVILGVLGRFMQEVYRQIGVTDGTVNFVMIDLLPRMATNW